MKNWQKIRENNQLINQFMVREQVIDALRKFFKDRDFHEVETPLLVKYPGTEPYLEVFETEVKFAEGDNHRAFLLTSPEFAMKKLLAAGFENIFQICKSFRNKEGRSTRHNPEFTILEYYRANEDYKKLMDDMEEMMLEILSYTTKNNEKTTIEYQGQTLNLAKGWPRYTVAQAFEKFASVTTEQLLSKTELPKIAKDKGYLITEENTWEQAYNQIFLNEIEAKLDKTRPTIIYDYPVSQAALSRRKSDDPRFAERFEFYLGGVELGNAFSELTNASEQKARFEAELMERKNLGKTEYGIDEDFIAALETGMPESAGIAIGVDRLVMLLADVPSIKDTLLFPIEEMF